MNIAAQINIGSGQSIDFYTGSVIEPNILHFNGNYSIGLDYTANMFLDWLEYLFDNFSQEIFRLRLDTEKKRI